MTPIIKLRPRRISCNVLQSDYNTGFIYRYFAKNRVSLEIVETDQESYNKIIKKDPLYRYEDTIVVAIYWKLTGPYRDTKVGDKIYYGVYDTNYRSVMKAEQTMPGIKNYLGNLTQFSKISTTENGSVNISKISSNSTL